MEPVVSGEELEGQLIALRTALAMEPDAGAILDREAVPQVEVHPTERGEQPEQLGRVVLPVAESVDPQVLVVADDVRLGLGDDPAIPARDDELAVDHVPEAFDHGPLGRSGPPTKVGPGRVDERPDGGRRRGLDDRRIVVAEVRQEELLVGVGRRDRIDRRAHGAPSGGLTQRQRSG